MSKKLWTNLDKFIHSFHYLSTMFVDKSNIL